MAYRVGRDNFYDMRNQPYYNNLYNYAPVEPEFQNSRPTKLNNRVLNRKFKKETIQLNDNTVLLISVQTPKNRQPFLVFSQCEGSFENKTDTVSIPESLVASFVQKLHKLSKWRPSVSSKIPLGQSLTSKDTVFRTQIVSLSDPETQPEAKLYAIKIFAETSAKDPAERRELSRVLIPLESSHLIKVKEALNDVLVTAVESPLYFTKSMQGCDGSKFYMDLIKDDKAHYLKISQVTRDFRIILHLPADDIEAFKTNLDACLKSMKGTEEQKAKKKRGRQGRKRHRREEKPDSADKDQKVSDKVKTEEEEKEEEGQEKKMEKSQEKKVEEGQKVEEEEQKKEETKESENEEAKQSEKEEAKQSEKEEAKQSEKEEAKQSEEEEAKQSEKEEAKQSEKEEVKEVVEQQEEKEVDDKEREQSAKPADSEDKPQE